MDKTKTQGMKNNSFLEAIHSKNSQSAIEYLKAKKQAEAKKREKLKEYFKSLEHTAITKKQLLDVLTQCQALLYFDGNEWAEEDKQKFKPLLKNAIKRIENTYNP